MPTLITQPQLIAAAATDAAEINSAIGAATSAAAGPTTRLVAAARDEVSAAAAALLGGYGKEYQALLKQAAAFPPDSFIQALETANTRFANTVSAVGSDAYATLLPTADIVNSLLTSVPAYDFDLFLSGVQQAINGDPIGGLVYAFGAPLAADTALLTLFGGFELRVLEHAAQQIVQDIAGTTPAPPGTVSL